MTLYRVKDLTFNDFFYFYGRFCDDCVIDGWTVWLNDDIVCIATLIYDNGVYILSSDFNSNIKHSAITTYRISCFIVEKALKYSKNIIAYGDINPSKYLLKLGFQYIGTQGDKGVYKL